MAHLTLDPKKLKPLQKAQGRKIGLIHPGSDQIYNSLFVSGGVPPLPGQGQIHIRQTQKPFQGHKGDLFMDPVVFLVPVGGKAQLPQHRHMGRCGLVSGKDDTGHIVPVGSGNLLRGDHIRPELLRGLALLPAVVVGKGMAADLLTGAGCNFFQQRGGKKAGRRRLVLPDFLQAPVGRQRGIFVFGT